MVYRPVDSVGVYLWGELVGALAAGPGRTYAFEYSAAWRRRGIEFAPLTMPTSGRLFSFPNLPEATFHRLPAAIADALPDAFGNALVTAYLEREGVERRSITALDRLAYQGTRGMGALEFRPGRGPRELRPTAIELGQLVDAARAAVRGQLTDDDGPARAFRSILRVGTSAGGARAKAVVAWNPSTGQLRSGQVPAEPGFEQWLCKLDGIGPDSELGTGQDYGRIEFAYSLMARAAGIDMPATRLLEEGGRAHFMVKRFDRGPDGAKLHMQSLCALAESDFNAIGVNDYAGLFATIDALGLGQAARDEAFRRAAFNVAAANCDDHTKNFAFLMTQDGTWSLAPAFDITHAYNPAGVWTHQHLMSVDGEFRNITRSHLLALADRFGVGAPRRLLSQVDAAIAAWPDFARQAGLPPTTTRQVAQDFRPVARQSDQTDDSWQAVDDSFSRTVDQGLGPIDFGPRRLEQPRDIGLTE